MLEELLMHLNNWFLAPDGVHEGVFTIEEGRISLPFLKNGQYFRVLGSLFNDGLYLYPAEGLADETFAGTIWALTVPQAVVSLSEEINVWDEKNGAAGPYTSESFGGYSYTRASNASGNIVGWQDVFKSRLNTYRKIGCLEAVRPTRRNQPPYERPFNPDYPWR